MDLQQKELHPPSLPATSPSATEFNSYSTVSTSESSSSPDEHNFNLPPAQHMNPVREAPDPNRIPKSIFARTNSKTPPMEWSVTSNESLFSIHIAKSGELSNNFTNGRENLQMGLPKETVAGQKEGISEPMMDKPKVNLNLSGCLNSNLISATSTPCESPGSAISCRNSATSTLSHNSFAFPVLTKDSKSKSLHGDLIHQLTLNEPSLPEQPLPETPISVKPAAPQNASCFSCFNCCSFAR